MTHVLNGVASLTHLGVIRAAGEDAVKFLQGQLTQDFALLKPDEARLAAFCSAKGRMQASFIGFTRDADDVLLICSRDILAPTLKRLSMFVLRAKAKLTDATADHALYGLAGEPAQSLFGPAAPAWSRTAQGEAHAIKLYAADGQPRALWVAPASAPAPAGPPLSLDLWQWGDVQSGVATLTAPIVEAFVPQMLNYESVGGVNFKKGCYPGQEVVARSQFRGTLKRRAYLAHLDGEAVAGQEVFEAAAEDSQPAGVVAQAAPAPGGGFDAIVSLQTAAAQKGGLSLGSAAGPALTLKPLPYALLEDI